MGYRARPISAMLRHIIDQRRQRRRTLPLRRPGALYIDADGELLAQLYAELIEGVDSPDGALHEHAVLIQGEYPAERAGRGLRIEQQRTRPVPRMHPMRHEPFDVLRRGVGPVHVGLHLRCGVTEGKRLRLAKTVL